MKYSYVFLVIAVLSLSINGNPMNYIGCYNEDPNNRDLEVAAGTGMNVAGCIAACASYNYAGLSNGGDCYCSDTYGLHSQTLETDCNRPCDANDTNNYEVCGGVDRNTVYHAGTCEGSECYDADIDYQVCHDHLQYLEFDSIKNECTPVSINDEQYYALSLTLENGYHLGQDCLTATISFEDTEIPGLIYDGAQFIEGANTYTDLPNEHFAYFPGTNSFDFNIKHTDMDRLGCEYDDSNPEEFVWQCNMALHIFLAGQEQFEFSFCMTIKLLKDTGYGDVDGKPIRRGPPLNITVNPNEYVNSDDCCENQLQIQTTLKFCTDFTCSAYLPDGQTVERKQDIFVEHSIITPAFDDYYLEGLQIKIGAFVPDIIDTDATQEGRLIYHFQSNIAMPGMIIEAISRIHKTPFTGRRRSLEADSNGVDDDYKLKAHGQLTITEIEEQQQKESKKSEQKESMDGYMIALITLGSVFGLLLVSVGIFFAVYTRKGFVPLESQADSGRNLKEQPVQNASLQNSDVQINV